MCAWNKAVQWSLYPMDSGWEIRTHIFSWMYMCCVSLFSRFSLPCISYWSKAGHTILLSFFKTTLLIFNRGDGSCKHVVALLFGIIDHITSMEDRSSIGVTDTAAYWDKPRKVCRPVPVHDLDIRCVTLFLYVLFFGDYPVIELTYLINIVNSTVLFWRCSHVHVLCLYIQF